MLACGRLILVSRWIMIPVTWRARCASATQRRACGQHDAPLRLPALNVSCVEGQASLRTSTGTRCEQSGVTPLSKGTGVVSVTIRTVVCKKNAKWDWSLFGSGRTAGLTVSR